MTLNDFSFIRIVFNRPYSSQHIDINNERICQKTLEMKRMKIG